MIISAYNAVDSAALASSPGAVATLPVGNVARRNGVPARFLDCTTLDITGDFANETAIGCAALAGLHGVPASGLTYWIVRLYIEPGQTGTPVYQSASQFFGPDDACLFDVFPPVAAQSFKVSLYALSGSDIDIGRLWLGPTWSPSVAPQYGLSLRWADASTQARAEAGNLLAIAGPALREMAIDLAYLTEPDRATLVDLMRYIGANGEVFISLYPGDATAAATDYALIGRLVGGHGSTARMFAFKYSPAVYSGDCFFSTGLPSELSLLAHWADRITIRESYPWDYARMMRGA